MYFDLGGEGFEDFQFGGEGVNWLVFRFGGGGGSRYNFDWDR